MLASHVCPKEYGGRNRSQPGRSRHNWTCWCGANWHNGSVIPVGFKDWMTRAPIVSTWWVKLSPRRILVCSGKRNRTSSSLTQKWCHENCKAQLGQVPIQEGRWVVEEDADEARVKFNLPAMKIKVSNNYKLAITLVMWLWHGNVWSTGHLNAIPRWSEENLTHASDQPGVPHHHCYAVKHVTSEGIKCFGEAYL